MHKVRSPKAPSVLVFTIGLVCVWLFTFGSAIAGACSGIRTQFSDQASAIADQCRARARKCNFGPVICHDRNVVCWGQVKNIRNSGTKKWQSCIAHEKRMSRNQERRKVEAVRKRENLRRSERKPQVNARRRVSLSTIYEKYQRVTRIYNVANGFYPDYKILANSKGDWRKQIEATQNLTGRVNDYAGRFWYSELLTDGALQGSAKIQTNSLSKFVSAMASTNVRYQTAVRAWRQRQAAKRRADTERREDEIRAFEIQAAEERREAARRAASEAAAQRREYARRAAAERARRQASTTSSGQSGGNALGTFLNGLARGAAAGARIYSGSGRTYRRTYRNRTRSRTRSRSRPRRSSGGKLGCGARTATNPGACY